MSFQSFKHATNMPYAASDMSATLFTGIKYPNGDTTRIYLAGGCIDGNYCTQDAKQVYNCWCTKITNQVIYFRPNPGGNSNTPSYSTAVTAMPEDRYRHTSVGIGSTLWVLGGVDLAGTLIKSVYYIDTLSDSAVWIKAFDWPDATCNLGSFGYGTKIYLVGGYDSVYNTMPTLAMFDVADVIGKTLPLTNAPIVLKSPMNVGRGDLSTVLSLSTLTAYAIGGWNGSDVNTENQWCSSYKVAEAYDIKTDKWSRLPDMLYARGQPVAGLLDNYLFAIGGEIKSANSLCSLSVPVGTVGRYDLGSPNSQWNFEGSIPLNLFRFVGVSDNANGSKVVYLFGGQGEYVQFSQPKNISNNMFVGYYPPQDATISYFPASLQSPSTPTLSPGGIAGIVIGVVCFVLGLAVAGFFYYGRHRLYYTQADIELSKNLPAGEEGSTEIDKSLQQVEGGRI